MRSTADKAPKAPNSLGRSALLALGAAAACGAWAVHTPPSHPALPGINLRTDPPLAASPRPPLPLEAFDATIWTPPPAPLAPEPVSRPTPKPAAPPPLTLVLLGIERIESERGVTFRAALHDTAADALHHLSQGERLGPLSVLEIDEQGVTIEFAGRTRRLPLSREIRP